MFYALLIINFSYIKTNNTNLTRYFVVFITLNAQILSQLAIRLDKYTGNTHIFE